jgi:hypothetical protein
VLLSEDRVVIERACRCWLFNQSFVHMRKLRPVANQVDLPNSLGGASVPAARVGFFSRSLPQRLQSKTNTPSLQPPHPTRNTPRLNHVAVDRFLTTSHPPPRCRNQSATTEPSRPPLRTLFLPRLHLCLHNGRTNNMANSTPQNTPANNAPISSHATAPGMSSINEGKLHHTRRELKRRRDLG